jgi:four helix bundle suffix protein
MLILLSRTINMLIRQKEAQGETFAQEGGFREKLTAVRVETRALAENAPICPECGKPMKRRTAKAGSNAGHDFWGCTGYPECKGVRKIERPDSTGATGGDKT